MSDQWSSWLLERRFGGDPTLLQRILPTLHEYRDKVLDGAKIYPGDTVLDVGCGDGLLGVAALERTTDAGTVIFSDISEDLLNTCREITGNNGQFVRTGLPDLADIPDASVDVAMTRSVLIYVDDKETAFRTLRRVLRDNGRLSIFEPINSFGWPEPDNVLWGCDVTGLEALAGKVKGAYEAQRVRAMMDCDERDLIAWAEGAGFRTVRLEYQVYVGPAEESMSWETLLKIAPNPLVPTFGEVLDGALDAGEYEALSRRLQEALPGRRMRRAGAYLTATR